MSVREKIKEVFKKKSVLERIKEEIKEKIGAHNQAISNLNELAKELESFTIWDGEGFKGGLELILFELENLVIQKRDGLCHGEIKIIKREREKHKIEIKDFFLEARNLIRKIILKTKRPEILGGLKILEAELVNLFQEFGGDQTSYQKAKDRILELKQQAEILSQAVPEEELNDSYYEILGISPQATDGQIRDVFLKLIQEYHPDRQPPGSREWVKQEAEKRAKKINEACDILGDPQKRKEYDKKIGGMNFE